MPVVLHFGADSQITLNPASEKLIAVRERTPGTAVTDPAAALASALSEPLGYPALREATVPGDRVAILWNHELPQAATLIAAVAQELIRGGVAAENICLVQGSVDTVSIGFEDSLKKALPASVRIIRHNPAASTELAYLAASTTEEALYLNRAVCEADLVIPIIAEREVSSGDRHGLAGIFSALADEATSRRLRGAASGAASRQNPARQVDEIAWLLGIRLIVAVVPGPGNSVLHVLAGDVDSVRPRAAELSTAAWKCVIDRPAKLVIAAIDGGPDQQSWASVARALAAAERVVEDGGAIVLCTELSVAPGPAVSRLAQDNDLDAVLKRRDRSADAWIALQIARALRQGPVYLLSHLAEEQVEELGITPLASAAEIGRLIDRYESCVLLESAQHLAPTVAQPAAKRIKDRP